MGAKYLDYVFCYRIMRRRTKIRLQSAQVEVWLWYDLVEQFQNNQLFRSLYPSSKRVNDSFKEEAKNLRIII